MEGPKTIPLNDGTSRAATYISVKVKSELEQLIQLGKIIPDWDYYADYVVSKATPIFTAMRWNMTPVFLNPNQTSLEDW